MELCATRGSASTGYTANNPDQYTAVGGAWPTYDADGNLTNDGTYTYCYDAESRLTKILSAGTCASPITIVASYAYDAQGRRKSRTVGSTTTIFVTDADNREILEYNGTTGTVGNWYAYGFGPNAVINQMNGAGTDRQTLIPDIQGSIIGSLDASAGALTKTGYQTFGESPGLSSGSFQYTAARFDPESSFYYMRSRMYRTDWGRFTQPDTIGYAGGNNLYAYVNNDPLNLTDPSGKDPLIGATVGLIAGTIYGGLGAAILPGASWKSIAAGAAAGGLVGAGIGALDPSLGIATLATVGGVAGGAGDFAGQAATNYLKGAAPLSEINGWEIAGAAVGGAVGGALTPLLPEAGWAGTAAEAYATGAPALLTTTVGSLLGAKLAQPATTDSSVSTATK